MQSASLVSLEAKEKVRALYELHIHTLIPHISYPHASILLSHTHHPHPCTPLPP